MSDHNPARPSWVCNACAEPWPCATRQRQLLAEFDGSFVSLLMYLSTRFQEAAQEQPDALAGDLYGRFILWARNAARTVHHTPASSR
jgi:hypothetical protein